MFPGTWNWAWNSERSDTRQPWRRPANDDELEIMTNFLHRIRKFTDEPGTRRERSVLPVAIVPDNFALAKNIGLDLKT